MNNTVRVVHLYKDGLHLNNYGRHELANNFIDNINSFLRPFFRWAIFECTVCKKERSSYENKSHK